MSINYELRKKHLGDKDGFVGHFKAKTVYDLEAVIDRMVSMGTSLTRTDLHAVLMLLESTIEVIILEGGKISLDDFISIYPSISGTFDGPDDSFDKSKHTIKVNAGVLSKFANKIRLKASMEKIKSTQRKPDIYEIYDFGSDSKNEHLSINDMVRIKGDNLKFDKSQADEGIFIINSNGNETKINYRDEPTATKLQFIMPEVDGEPGSVEIEIRTRYNTNTMRNGKTDLKLNVYNIKLSCYTQLFLII